MHPSERLQHVPVADVPDPPLASGAPYWYWLGGRPAVDLVNTRRERWNRRIECLVTPADLGGWLVAAGVLDAAPARIPRAVLDEARELREAIDACIEAAVRGAAPDPADVAAIDRWLVHAGPRPALLLDAGEQPVLAERPAADSPRRALGQIALDAAQMLGTPEQRARIRTCASETCSARFYDRSPAGRRRWCSMKTCGNTAKARRHRARTRAAS
jgi:predicted RNA-binding Zn ribbon-like protein